MRQLTKRKKLGLALIWSVLGTFYLALAASLTERKAVDVLGNASDDERPTLETVVATNRVRLANPTRPPGPLLPDLVAHPPRDVGLSGSRETGTLRLQFTTRFSNQGDGPLEVRAGDDGEDLWQVIYGPDPERPLDTRSEVGRYTYEQAHGHLHIEAFAHYQLWSVDAAGERLELLVSNPKVGFCLIDAETLDPERTPVESRVYWGCGSEVQGLSVGWGDIYTALLATQDLNVSTLPDGRYALVNLINHQQTLYEKSYDNNSAQILLSLRGGALLLE